jgi:propanol-preferring alcohol dehydrogenase
VRAWRLHASAPAGEHPLSLEEIPRPRPAADELLVRVRACGVCRTDLHVVEGDLPEATRPIVPGHMVVGQVVDAGEDVDLGAGGPGAGDRVGIAWLRSTCGTCDACADGRENLCPNARFTGYHVDGGYAEYATVPAAWAYPIPDGLSDLEAAPLLCAGIIGYRALRLSGVRPGQRLGLYGFGNSAHIVLPIARARGCEVFVASRAESHRSLALELGASWAGETSEMPPGLHAAILFAPAGELVPPALRALRPGGTLACAGIHMTRIPSIDYDTELFGERVLRSVTANTRADGLELLEEASRIGLRPRVTEYALDEAGDALADLASDRVSGAAVLRVD